MAFNGMLAAQLTNVEGVLELENHCSAAIMVQTRIISGY